MYKHYLTTAFRSARKDIAGFSINILGLMLGLAVFSFAFAYTEFEKQYDQFWEKTDRIVSPVVEVSDEFASSFSGTISTYYTGAMQAARDDLPQVEEATMITRARWPVKIENTYFPANIVFTDDAFFRMFNLDFIVGDASTFATSAEAAILSRTQAMRLFGTVDAIGKTFEINYKADARVVGVYEDLRLDSHFTGIDNGTESFGIVVAIETGKKLHPESYYTSWQSLASSRNVFFLLKEGTDRDLLAKDLSNLTKGRLTERGLEMFKEAKLMSLPDLHAAAWNEGGVNGMYIVRGIGTLILLIAVLNAISLNSARMLERSREIAMRRILGATRGNLITQLISENVIIAFMALILSFGLLYLILMQAASFTGREISIADSLNGGLLIFLALSAIVVGVISSFYPILLLSGVSKNMSLVRTMQMGHSASRMRKILATIQFTIVSALIFAVLVVAKQNAHIVAKAPNFDFDSIVVIDGLHDAEAVKRVPILQTALARDPNIESISFSTLIPYTGSTTISSFYKTDDLETDIAMQIITIDDKYIPMFNMPLIVGRNLDVNRGDDVFSTAELESGDPTTVNVVINEEALAAMSLGTAQQAIGKSFLYEAGGDTKHPMRVVGVLENQQLRGQGRQLHPIVFMHFENDGSGLGIKYRNAETIDLKEIDGLVREIIPGSNPSVETLRMGFDDSFVQFKVMFYVVLGLAAFTFMLASSGLYGLAAYLAMSRRQEVGIRKVLGASNGQIIRLFLLQFSWPLIFALLIGLPIGTLAMMQYLNSFIDRISLNPLIYIEAIALTFFIGWSTVFVHIWRAARTRPAEVLRDE